MQQFPFRKGPRSLKETVELSRELRQRYAAEHPDEVDDDWRKTVFTVIDGDDGYTVGDDGTMYDDETMYGYDDDLEDEEVFREPPLLEPVILEFDDVN